MLAGPVPEHLPGEPVRTGASPAGIAVRVLFATPALALLFTATAGLWPLYLVSVLVWGWPPNVPRSSQVARYLHLAFTATPPAPGLSWPARAWIASSVLQKVAIMPVAGLAWQLDELLYGRALRDTPVVAPLLEISAGRSGSTQIARYLEGDPHLAAPGLIYAMFPYLWLWKLAPATVGRFITRAQVTHRIEALMPPEFLQRHEGDPFLTDTFDGPFYMGRLNGLAGALGPDVLVDDFGFASNAPHAATLWEEDFVAFLDRVGRKTLVHAGPGPDGKPRRLFVKGHFLRAADALARRYPDARFLTVIRDPASRLQSAVNYMRANPHDPVLGPTPWAWWSAALVRTETLYNATERAWFSRPEGPRRCVVQFTDFLADLEGTMAKVYRECLDVPELPAHVPRAHPPRERTKYLLNRTLAQAGIDEAAFVAAQDAQLVSTPSGAPP